MSQRGVFIMTTIKKYPHQTFRPSKVLVNDIERLSKKLKINKSSVIRLSLEEAVNKYLGSESKKK